MADNDALERACEVPLVEQLRSIPKEYRTVRAIQWSEDGRETGHQFIPVGFIMHKAADEIDRLNALLSESVAHSATAPLKMPSMDEIQLACGELTAGEKRTVRAVLGWFIRRVASSNASGAIDGSSKK